MGNIKVYRWGGSRDKKMEDWKDDERKVGKGGGGFGWKEGWKEINNDG